MSTWGQIGLGALALVFVVALTGCECGNDSPGDAGRARPREGASAGGDEAEDPSRGPAIAMPSESAPSPTRFTPVDPALAAHSARARGWANVADLRAGSMARMSLGNWLCRVWTHYGAPPQVQRDGFVYAFRDGETGEIITAYSAGSGPAMGGVILDEGGLPVPGAQQRVASSVDAFVALMDATAPNDCELELETDYGRIRIGVRGGEWFEEEAE